MLFRLAVMVLLLNMFVISAEAAPPAPVIKVDASTLAAGSAASIANTGSLGGNFIAGGVSTPVVETVAGKKAITFNGSNGYKSDFTAPANVTGVNAWSVATWIYNPTVGDAEYYFQLAHRKTGTETNGQAAIFAYKKNDQYAACSHYDRYDIGWGRLYYPPAEGQWHHIVLTYDGAPPTAATVPGTGTGTECVYVDGVLVNRVMGKPLNLVTGTPVLLGCEQRAFPFVNDPGEGYKFDKVGLSGSIASLQVFAGALSSDDVVSLAGGQTLNVAGLPLLGDNSFENYIFGGNQRTQGAGDGGLYGASITGKPYGMFNCWNDFTFGGVPPGGPSGKNNNFHVAHASNSVWNNGMNVDGGAVAGIETVEPLKASLVQPLWNAKPSTTYKVWGWFNARGFNIRQGNLQIVVDDTSVFSSPVAVTPVDADNAFTKPFQRIEGTFSTDGGANHWLAIQNTATATNSGELLIDRIQVAEVDSPGVPVICSTEVPKLTSLDFYGVAQGSSLTKSFNLYNDGGSAFTVTGLSIVGADAAQFAVVSSVGTVDPYGASALPVQVKLQPNTTGVFNAQLKIDTNIPSTVYLPLSGFSTPQVANGSFELPYIETGGGDYQPSYPGWNVYLTKGQSSQLVGFSYNGQWKLDNGVPPDGRQAAQLDRSKNDNSLTSISQTIPGFVAGHTYRFRFYANSWKGTTSNAYDGKVWTDFKVNGASATGVSKTPASGAGSTVDFPGWITNLEAGGTRTKNYDKYEFDWTAPASGAYPIEFDAIGSSAGDAYNSLLLDNVGVFDKSVAGPASASATRLDFGTRQLGTTGTQTLTVSNLGGADFTITGAAFTGATASEFSLGTALPVTVVGIGGSQSLSVRLVPTAVGQKDATMTLTTSVGPVAVALTGSTPIAPLLRAGSFESPVLNSPTADNNNNNADGWNGPGGNKSGRTSMGSYYANNGVTPDGGYLMWLRKGTGTDDTTKTIYQDVAGFRANRTYRVTLYANASSSGTSPMNNLPVTGNGHLNVKLNATTIIDTTVTQVDPFMKFVTPYTRYQADFTTTANCQLRLNISATPTTRDNALLIDGVTIQEVAPLLQASPASVRFNTVNWFRNDKPSTATVTLTNNGLQPLTFTGGATGTPGLAIVNGNYAPAQFSIVSTTPANKASLAVGESMTVLVRFNPTYKGVYTASAVLRVTSNDPNYSPLDIPLAGDGVPVELSTFSAE